MDQQVIASAAACDVLQKQPLPTQPSPSEELQVRRRRVEMRWREVLLYPLSAVWLLALLAFLLTACSVFALGLVAEPQSSDWPRHALLSAALLLAAMVLGHLAALFSGILASSVGGAVQDLARPRFRPDRALRNFGRWLACFAAGPAVAIAAGAWYLLHCGDLGAIDWFVLAELFIPAIGYWLVALLLIGTDNPLRDAEPRRVIEAIRRLGLPIVTACLLISCGVLGHVLLFAVALEQFQVEPVGGFVELGLTWFSLLYCSAAALRYLGLRVHFSQTRAHAQTP